MTDPAAPKSENTPPRSRAPMQLVSERQVADTATLSGLIAGQTTTTPTTTSPIAAITASLPSPGAEFQHRVAWKASVLATLNVLFVILAIRLSLIVSIVGAIVLTYIAINAPDPYRLAALGIYSVVIVAPMVWLASRR